MLRFGCLLGLALSTRRPRRARNVLRFVAWRLLTLAVPADMVSGIFTSGSLSLNATLGQEEVLPCVGFDKCDGFVWATRSFEIDFPQP